MDLTRLVQRGIVMETDPSALCARVKHEDTGIISDWLQVLQHLGAVLEIEPDGLHTHAISDTWSGGGSAAMAGIHQHPGSVLGRWMPEIGSAVLVLYEPVEDGNGYILGGIGHA